MYNNSTCTCERLAWLETVWLARLAYLSMLTMYVHVLSIYTLTYWCGKYSNSAHDAGVVALLNSRNDLMIPGMHNTLLVPSPYLVHEVLKCRDTQVIIWFLYPSLYYLCMLYIIRCPQFWWLAMEGEVSCDVGVSAFQDIMYIVCTYCYAVCFLSNSLFHLLVSILVSTIKSLLRYSLKFPCQIDVGLYIYCITVAHGKLNS